MWLNNFVIFNLLFYLQDLQSLKSKALDSARALQSYMHLHITVSGGGRKNGKKILSKVDRND